MKKQIAILIVSAATLLAGCSTGETKPTFEYEEYTIVSGDFVRALNHQSSFSYHLVGDHDSSIVASSDGSITYPASIPNYTQVMYQASNGLYESDIVVITLTHEVEPAEISILNPSDYIADGNSVLASNDHDYAMRYELVGDTRGIVIDSATGVVSFTSIVKDDDSFTVRVSCGDGSHIDHTFKAAVSALAASETKIQAAELDGTSSVAYRLDFSNVASTFEKGVKGIYSNSKVFATSEEYSYNANNNLLTVRSSFLNKLNVGENTLNIVTERNTISVNFVLATAFIRDAEDLVGIAKDGESLRGYYVQAGDIDLTQYIESLEDNKGWTPIGVYRDVTDGTALSNAFAGTYDGNGYSISGFYMNRRDEYGFNAGLFGYTTNLALIKNLTVHGQSGKTNSVASYSGGLVGVNAGDIVNCYSDVNVSNYSDGEDVYNMVGGLCGRNLGNIEGCIAASKNIQGDKNIGALVGFNEGSIKNSYAISSSLPLNEGIVASNGEVFASEADMKAYDFSEKLDSKYWDLAEGEIPATKQYIESFYPVGMKILNPIDSITRGETYKPEVAIYPEYLYSDFIELVEYSVDGAGYRFEEGVLYTEEAIDKRFSITASLTYEGVSFSETQYTDLVEKVVSISIDESVPSTMAAGNSYELGATILPEGASTEVTWSIVTESGALDTKTKGISIVDGVLTIATTCEATSFYLKATSADPDIYVIKKIDVTPIAFPFSKFATSYGGEDLVFSFDSDPTGMKAYIDNVEVEGATIEGGNVSIPTSGLPQDEDIEIIFVSSSGEKSIGYGLVSSHAKYDYESVKGEDVIEIGTVRQWRTYFNCLTLKESRYEYYDKTFVLTADLDFSDSTYYGIGYESHPFTGKIYGCGHKLSNLNIKENESYNGMSDTEKKNVYRSSLYNVGLFGTFGGEVYDLVLDNIKVDARSFVGTFAGTATAESVIENVSFTNCHAYHINGSNYSDSEVRAANVACIGLGTMRGVLFDGKKENLIEKR